MAIILVLNRVLTLSSWLPLVLVVATTLLTPSVQAHEVRPAIAELQVINSHQLSLHITANLEALISDIGVDHEDTDDSPQAANYNALREQSPAELTQAFARFEPRLLQGVTLTGEQQPLRLSVQQVDVPAVGDVDLPRASVIRLSGVLPPDVTQLNYRWAAEFGASVLRVRDADGQINHTQFLRDGASSDPVLVQRPMVQSIAAQFVHFVGVGFTHIVPKGLDHILFVIGLFLLSMRWTTLLWQITVFTIAHTITLALAMLNLVSLPAAIVEPAIAASIVYICVENLVTDTLSRWRLLVVFLFGLLHGLGFASVLADIGLASTQFVVGLLAFNVGVELGQICVVIVCVVLLGAFRQRSWYRSMITRPASIVVGLIGAWWFVERVFLQ